MLRIYHYYTRSAHAKAIVPDLGGAGRGHFYFTTDIALLQYTKYRYDNIILCTHGLAYIYMLRFNWDRYCL